MIISCPHCRTRYQVAPEVIGATGRKVQCANCHRDWRAALEPEPAESSDDRLFEALNEERLDDAFEDAERAEAGGVVTTARTEPMAHIGPGDTNSLRRRLRRLAARERLLLRQMPQARLRRLVRLVAGGLLVLLLGGLLGFRTEIVREVPSLAGLYEAVGLKVNVVGLDFRDVRTLKALSSGVEKLVIDATIVSVAHEPVAVPAIVVTLTDQAGAPLYEWSAAPPTGVLGPGETVPFETQLPAPPGRASGVRLRFGAGGDQ